MGLDHQVDVFVCTAATANQPDVEQIFIDPQVQLILRRVTGFDMEKVFHTRKTLDPEPPQYKLLTDQQLQQVCQSKTKYLLHDVTIKNEVMSLMFEGGRRRHRERTGVFADASLPETMDRGDTCTVPGL